MRRLYATLPAALVAMAVFVPQAAQAATAEDIPSTPVTGEVYYKVALAAPASTQDVLAAAQKYQLAILSMRHAGTTSGELIVGSMPLDEALGMYRETNIDNFGTPPEVVSFITDDAPPLELLVAGAVPATVTEQGLSSTDPTPDESDVGAANIQDPWAPRRGTLWAHNSSTGAPRQVRHRLTWDSRSGLNSYQTSDAEFVYEHDHKIFDRDPWVTAAMGHKACMPDYWLGGDTRIVTSNNVPDAAQVYADNARASDDCGTHDISFGIFHPEKLSINYSYKIVVGGNAGGANRSPFGLLGQKMVRSCGVDSAWCVSLGSDPRERYDLFINDSRGWKVPGCYTWYRSNDRSPVRGSC